jgi:hypothetical protein
MGILQRLFPRWLAERPNHPDTSPDGLIGALGLGDWWLDDFTTAEREMIEERFKPLGFGNSRPLTQGNFRGTKQSPASLLQELSGWFIKPDPLERRIARRIASKAEELALEADKVMDLHFVYLQQIRANYRDRETSPEFLQAAIEACMAQIAIAPQVAEQFLLDYPDSPLPAHTGFEQLSIIYEKQGKYAEALDLCREAARQGWRGEWDKRSARIERKLKKTP